MEFEAFNLYSLNYLFQRNIVLPRYSIRTPRIPPNLGDSIKVNFSLFVPLLSSLLRRLGPSIGLYLALEMVGKVVTPLNSSIDWTMPANLEYAIFGKILALEVQRFRLYSLDCLFNAIYLVHPFYLMVVLLILYKKNRGASQHFSRATLLTSYIGFVVFLFYPVAPPWLAVAGVENTPRTVMNHFSSLWNLPITYDNFNPALFAAIPSLHCALAWTATLCMRKLGKAYGSAMFLFTLGVWIGTVYTGNHFIIDIILGIALATVTYQLADPSSSFYQTVKRWRGSIASRFR